MNQKRKADLRGIGLMLKTSDYFADNQRAFSKPNYSETMPAIQCSKCVIMETRLQQFERLTMLLANHIDEQRRPL